jgi:hypothetical protein
VLLFFRAFLSSSMTSEFSQKGRAQQHGTGMAENQTAATTTERRRGTKRHAPDKTPPPPDGSPAPSQQEPLAVATATKRKKEPAAGALQPWALYDPRRVCHSGMVLAPENSAPQMALSEGGTVCSNDRGYRTARASYPCEAGDAMYLELDVLAPRAPAPFAGVAPHVRVGWATERADLQAPVGYDWYGFGCRDSDGAVFHQARRHPAYQARPFAIGDTVGLLLRLPLPADGAGPGGGAELACLPIPGSTASGRAKHVERLVAHPGSEIEWFVNGVSQGVAFRDAVPRGAYYPAASCYMGGCVRLRFAPPFKYPLPPMAEPAADIGTRKAVEAAAAIARQRLQEEEKARGEETAQPQQPTSTTASPSPPPPPPASTSAPATDQPPPEPMAIS